MIYPSLPHAQYDSQRHAILDAVQRVFESGFYILGPETDSFERSFSVFCGTAFAVGVNSGTDALILAMKALGIGSGDEVITVSHTALATVAAVVAAGATPVLVDVDPDSYTINPQLIEPALTSRTKAIIAVHLYGQTADLDAVLAVARRNGLAVIEDCAQAAGGRYKGRRVGSIGDAGCFSFYPTKNLGAIGDGGMVITSDKDLSERIRRLRQYGWDASRNTTEPGLNSRLDEIQAAILSVRLQELDRNNARRVAIARRYNASLSSLPVKLPFERPDSEHVFHLYVLLCDDRDALCRNLATQGIVAGVHYPVPAHCHGGYDRVVRIPADGLPVTDELAGRVLTLPLYPELSDQEVDRIITSISSCFQ